MLHHRFENRSRQQLKSQPGAALRSRGTMGCGERQLAILIRPIIPNKTNKPIYESINPLYDFICVFTFLSRCHSFQLKPIMENQISLIWNLSISIACQMLTLITIFPVCTFEHDQQLNEFLFFCIGASLKFGDFVFKTFPNM